MSKIYSVAVDFRPLMGGVAADYIGGPRNYAFVVWELDANGGQITDRRPMATGCCYESRQEAMAAGNKVRAGFEMGEAELLAGDRELAACKIERGDQHALREQIQRQGCFL